MEWAHRELLTPHMITLAAVIAGSFMVIFAILGPFFAESFLTPIQRARYVVPVVSCVSIVLYCAFVVTVAAMRYRPTLQIMISLVVMVVIVAVPSTAMLYTAYAIALADHFPGSSPDADLPRMYVQVAMLLLIPTSIVFYALRLRVPRILPAEAGEVPGTGTPDAAGFRHDAPAAAPAAGSAPDEIAQAPDGPGAAGAGEAEPLAPAPDVSPDPNVPFFDRLPDALGRDVVYLKASGHYLDVVTTAGSAAVLMRLADAVAQLGNRGVQIHRSYWVASRHAAGMVRHGHRTMLRLPDGHELPIGRSFLPEVRRRLRPI